MTVHVGGQLAKAKAASRGKKKRASDHTKRQNGNGAARAEVAAAIDHEELLGALQAMRMGDFSVRLPGDYTGLAGKVADTFNEIVGGQPAHGPAARARRARWSGGRARRAGASISAFRTGAWGEMENSVNTLIDDLLWPTAEVTRAIAAVAQGRPAADRAARRGRPAAARRIPALGHHRQHDD